MDSELENKIKELLSQNSELKKLKDLPKEKLQLMRIYLNLNMAQITGKNEDIPFAKFVKAGNNDNFNLIENILANKYRVDISEVSVSADLHKTKNIELTDNSNYEVILKRDLAIFMDEINKYNNKYSEQIEYIDIIDYMLNRRVPEFRKNVELKFFEEINIIDLLYVLIILEADLINLNSYDEEKSIIEVNYLNLISKKEKISYINMLLDFYKDGKYADNMKLSVNSKNNIFGEEDQCLRVYKIAAFYKFLIEVKKIDIIKSLRKLLNEDNIYHGMKIRAQFFKARYFNKVEKLPYSKKTKDEIYKILNYVLNYRYNIDTPYIPINILIYSNDKEAVEYVCYIIGSFMFFFGYLQLSSMNYYDEYINNVILDKNKIKNVFNGKRGMLLLHNFENLSYVNSKDSDLILNIITDEMEENNNNLCTVIYGEKALTKSILDKYPKLSEKLINLELEIDDLTDADISKILIDKLETKEKLSDEVKDKIRIYVRETYKQSNVKNLDYINKLYSSIILNSNSYFSVDKKSQIGIDDIPYIKGIRDLPTILKDLNSLIGLTSIKEQIKDLIYLLKYNKHAKMNLDEFNLHMVFTGNPGTGKTTVARIITDILFNLNYISKNKLIEVTSRDLIAEYVGQTQEKTFNVIKSALGGVLFIDEAYSITMVDMYGEECIATIIKMMEDYKDQLVIIFAGYKNEMKKFIDKNAGLKSRIGYTIEFLDYTTEELMKIFKKLLLKNRLAMTSEAEESLEKIISSASKSENFGNARFVNNIFQKVLIEHAKNVEINKKENVDLFKIEKNDINPDKLKPESYNKKIGF